MYAPLPRTALIALAALLTCLLPATGNPPEPDGRGDEKLLKKAGLATDGPGLLDFFRKRTPTEEDRKRLEGLVRDLGARKFGRREKATGELIAAGELAVGLLKEAAKGSDPEVVRRAEYCLREIDKAPHAARAAAAARLLALKRPDSAAEVLLAYLPYSGEESLEATLLETLAVVGLERDGKAPVAAVRKAVTDDNARRRAAAAYVLGRTKDGREVLADLLADTDAMVRYRAAIGLIRGGDRKGVPALIRLLADGEREVAWRAEEVLYRLAGDKAPPAGLGEDAKQRLARRQAWEAWWKEHGDAVKLASADLDGAELGLVIDCEVDGVGRFPGRVVAFDRAGKKRWTIDGIESPADVRLLPGGRVLVAEHWAKRVIEVDRQGKVVWEHKVADQPVSCQRLPNGNTFIGTRTELLEVTPAGKVTFSHKLKTTTYCAEKLRNGNVLYIDSGGQVTEIDAAGKAVRSFRPQTDTSGASYWAAIEPLKGGRYLICLSGTGKVVETDAAGKILWKCNVPTACWATRLRNGNTLVANADGKMLVEVNPQGKEVWKVTTQGRPFRARRY